MDWDMHAIQHQIWAIKYHATSGRNDGWTQFGAKQDLYKLKWQIEQALADCSTFIGETEWLQEQEQERIIKILKS